MNTVMTTEMTYGEFEELTRQLGIVGYEFVPFMEANNDTSWNFFVDKSDIERAQCDEAKIISKPARWSGYVTSVLALLVGKGILSGENFSITVSW